MKRGGGKGGKSQKTSYSKAIETQAKTNTRQAKVNETKQKISTIQTKKSKLETQIKALETQKNNYIGKISTKNQKIQKKISKKEKKKAKLKKKQDKKEAKLAQRQQKLINTQAKLNTRKELAGINTKTAEGVAQQKQFDEAVTAFKTRVETRKINKTQRKLKRKQTKSKAKAKRLNKLTKKREKQAAKEQRKKDGTLGFFEKHFNFTKKVSESNVDQAKINKNSLNSNVKYYTNKVETLQLKKAKKEAQENKTKTITSVDELQKDQNGKLIIPELKNNYEKILDNIEKNEKYLGINVDAIRKMENKDFVNYNKDNFISNIEKLKDTYEEEYSKLMEKKNELTDDEKETLLKLIEINREYGLNFSKLED